MFLDYLILAVSLFLGVGKNKYHNKYEDYFESEVRKWNEI